MNEVRRACVALFGSSRAELFMPLSKQKSRRLGRVSGIQQQILRIEPLIMNSGSLAPVKIEHQKEEEKDEVVVVVILGQQRTVYDMKAFTNVILLPSGATICLYRLGDQTCFRASGSQNLC